MKNTTKKIKSVKDKVFLSEDELSKMNSLRSEYNNIKSKLGELDLMKDKLMKRANEIGIFFIDKEKHFAEKYGEKAVINFETGEVTTSK